MSAVEPMTAKTIIALLERRHSKDVFVAECKDGPTVATGTHLRMDGWAMKKSWTQPMTWAYEVKVSRSDFLRDDKWPGYLDFCNQFYFVCPWGLISPEETPEQAGLLWVTKTGSRLMIKKKASHRDVTVPEELFRYLLMSRAKIVDNWHYAGNVESDRDYWSRWLQSRELDFEFGRRVSASIKETVKTRITEVDEENRRMQRKVKNCQQIEAFLAEMGIDTKSLDSDFGIRHIKRRIQEVQEVVTVGHIQQLKMTAHSITSLANALTDLREGGQS